MEKVAKVTKVCFLLLFGFASILVFKNTSGFDIETIAQRLIFPAFFMVTVLGIFQRVFIVAFVIGITYMIFTDPVSVGNDMSTMTATVVLFTIMGLPLFFKKLNVMPIEVLAFNLGSLSIAISAIFSGKIISIPTRYNHRITTINVSDNPTDFWVFFAIYLVTGIALSFLTYKNFKNKKFFNSEKGLEN